MLRDLEKYKTKKKKKNVEIGPASFDAGWQMQGLKANIGLLMKLAPPQKRQKYDGYWKKFHHNSSNANQFLSFLLKG